MMLWWTLIFIIRWYDPGEKQGDWVIYRDMHNPHVIPACEEFSGVSNPCAICPDKNPSPDLLVVLGVKIE